MMVAQAVKLTSTATEQAEVQLEERVDALE